MSIIRRDALGGLGGFGWADASGQKERAQAVKAYAHAGCSLSSTPCYFINPSFFKTAICLFVKTPLLANSSSFFNLLSGLRSQTPLANAS